MRIPTGHPDRTSGHTNRNRYMTVLKTQTLLSELVNIRSGSFYLGTINSNGVTVHVIQSNEHDIQFWISKNEQAGSCRCEKEEKKGVHDTH